MTSQALCLRTHTQTTFTKFIGIPQSLLCSLNCRNLGKMLCPENFSANGAWTLLKGHMDSCMKNAILYISVSFVGSRCYTALIGQAKNKEMSTENGVSGQKYLG